MGQYGQTGRFGQMWAPMLGHVAEELVSTTRAARAIGVSQSTLVSWVQQGLVTPHFTTVGGHYRWEVERLKAEIRAMQQRDE